MPTSESGKRTDPPAGWKLVERTGDGGPARGISWSPGSHWAETVRARSSCARLVSLGSTPGSSGSRRGARGGSNAWTRGGPAS